MDPDHPEVPPEPLQDSGGGQVLREKVEDSLDSSQSISKNKLSAPLSSFTEISHLVPARPSDSSASISRQHLSSRNLGGHSRSFGHHRKPHFVSQRFTPSPVDRKPSDNMETIHSSTRVIHIPPNFSNEPFVHTLANATESEANRRAGTSQKAPRSKREAESGRRDPREGLRQVLPKSKDKKIHYYFIESNTTDFRNFRIDEYSGNITTARYVVD